MNHPVDLILPLPGNVIPADESAKQAFLVNLAIYVEHSDDEKVLLQPETSSIGESAGAEV
ncbi:hypothetical protein NSS98_22695 [Paenibacillus sp. FSL E2-0274]|uniref:hypothetical protein n=1 Tax=Paenibacillus TaxID=44249 RepID=UPI00096F92AB|nr:hypothetical protein [Paenibacillus odorifer]OME30062.1 hypothetical protein BSK63_19100 [Paenibacillus odorifer]